VALQRAVRPVVAVRRYAAPHAGPWLDAVAGEPHGTPVRRVAPWPEAPLGAPYPVVVPLVGLLARPGHLGEHHLDLLALGPTSRCSP
jgi:hypothetical protein